VALRSAQTHFDASGAEGILRIISVPECAFGISSAFLCVLSCSGASSSKTGHSHKRREKGGARIGTCRHRAAFVAFIEGAFVSSWATGCASDTKFDGAIS